MTAPAFKHRQRVAFRRLVGPDFAEDWTEKATILVTKRRHHQPPPGYWVVRFDDGGSLCVHGQALRAVR